MGGPEARGSLVLRDEWQMNEMNDAGTVPRLRIAAGVVALVLAATGCIAHGLAFVKSNQVRVYSPKSHSLVKTPVTIRWEVHDFRITGHDGRSNPNAGYFGVLCESAPEIGTRWRSGGDSNSGATEASTGGTRPEFSALFDPTKAICDR